MKGKFGIVALLFSSMAFAGPVSTPNNVNDTPIISGGGSVSGGICRAYQTNGTAVNLSGGETLVFYGTGGRFYLHGFLSFYSHGGYLSTKPNYSGTAYVKVKGGGYVWGNCNYACSYSGSAIGLFARNTDSRNDFIAGAGAGGVAYGYSFYYGYFEPDYNASSGGGWRVRSFKNVCGVDILCSVSPAYGGDAACPDSRLWFTTYYFSRPVTPGFCSSYELALGAASSISAWYNSYTKDYTSFGTSLTISGGGYSTGSATLYVCQ